MTVESMVQEAKNGMDALIPPIPQTVQLPNVINISVPESKIRFEYAQIAWSPLDSIATVCMITGLLILGYLIRIVLG